MAKFKVQLIPIYEDHTEKPMDITTRGVIVGRENDCEYVIKGDGVSRYHACFFQDGTRIMVEDLESTNGVTVNGKRIDGKHELHPGDVVQVCDFSFLIAGNKGAVAPGVRARITFLLIALIIMLLGIIGLVNYLSGKDRGGSSSPSTLGILSDPSGAQVFDHGKLVGKTPLLLEGVKEGSYRLLLRLDGYSDLEIVAEVPQGATRKIHSLEKLNIPKELRIKSLPSNAKVYVDGVLKGITQPPESGEGESEVLVIKNVDLSVRHKVHITANNRTSPTVLTKKWMPEIEVVLWQPDRLVHMADGTMHLGMIRNRLPDGSVVLAMENGENIVLKAAGIKSIKEVVPPVIKDRTYGMTINQDENGNIELTVDPFPDEDY